MVMDKGGLMARIGHWSALLTLITVYCTACSPVVLSQKAALDTPSRHVENGIKLLNYGKIDDAFREFNRARELDPEYAAAYVGLGFCYGLKGDYEKGMATMKEAQKYIRPSTP
jgi:Flp pilus assembly protein TadD